MSEQASGQENKQQFQSAINTAELNRAHEVALEAERYLSKAEARHTPHDVESAIDSNARERFTQDESWEAITRAEAEVVIKKRRVDRGKAADEPSRITHGAADIIAPELEERRRNSEREATTDALTGLPNRAAFNKMTEGREPGEQDIVMIDGDGFKLINDTLGHEGGDAAIKAIAEALDHTSQTINGVRAARFGGDEFALICEPGQGDEALRRAQEYLAWKRTSADAPPFVDELGREYPRENYAKFSFTGAVGDCLSAADAAMYDVKRKR